MPRFIQSQTLNVKPFPTPEPTAQCIGARNPSCLFSFRLCFFSRPIPSVLTAHTSFCLTKNARKCVSCHAQVTPRTASWIRVHRTTREFVLSDWSRNSASRSCIIVSIFLKRPRPASALCTTHSLEDLLSPDVQQPRVQILHFFNQRLDMCLVCALDPACFSNSHIQCELDRTMNATAQPASTLNVLRSNTNAMLTGVGGTKGKFALASTSLSNDTVVVVKSLLNGDEDTYVRLRLEGLGSIIPHFGVIMSYSC